MSLVCDTDKIYQLLGNISREKLPIEVVLPLYYNTTLKFCNIMKLSGRNPLLRVEDRNVVTNPFPLSIPDFGEQKLAQILVNDGGGGLIYRSVRLVAYEALESFAYDDQIVASIVGTGDNLALQFSQRWASQVLPATVRIYYTPSTPLDPDAGYSAESPIIASLKPAVEYATAALCIPHIKTTTEEETNRIGLLAASLGAEALDWRAQFEALTHITGEHRARKKIPFSRSRQRF